jgi:hypothetical protein
VSHAHPAYIIRVFENSTYSKVINATCRDVLLSRAHHHLRDISSTRHQPTPKVRNSACSGSNLCMLPLPAAKLGPPIAIMDAYSASKLIS